jgi:tetratricopeptide (TPR) repeat protein
MEPTDARSDCRRTMGRKYMQSDSVLTPTMDGAAATPRSSRAVVLMVIVLLAAGCRVPTQGRGVSKTIIQSRQLSQQGMSAIERKNYNEAERLLAQAVQTCGADPEARRFYAESLWHNGKRQEAIRQLDEAMLLAPSDPVLRRKMAEFQLELGQLERALLLANEALDLDPHDAASWIVRARVHQQANHLQAALADYQRALGLNANQPDAMLAIAELHRRQNHPDRALAALQSVSEAYAPGEEPAHVYYLMGLASGAMGRHEDALAHYETARRRGDDSPELLYALAHTQWMTGQPIQAEQTAYELLARTPQHEPGRQLIEHIRTTRAPSSTLR